MRAVEAKGTITGMVMATRSIGITTIGDDRSCRQGCRPAGSLLHKRAMRDFKWHSMAPNRDHPTLQAAAESLSAVSAPLGAAPAHRLKQVAICCALIFALRASLTVWADDRVVVADFSLGADARGVPEAWQLVEKSGQPSLSLAKMDGLNALVLRSADSSFSIQRQVKVDLEQYPILTWKWKITKLPAGGDFRKAKTDDQAAQLFLALSRTRAIVYLWDTTAPQGLIAEASAPPPMRIKAVVVRSGPSQTGRWITETRNVYEDYRKLYGGGDKALVVSGMRIQINTQHTKTSAESCFADLVFKKQ